MIIRTRAPRNKAEWEDYYDLRYRILRAPLDQPRGSEKNEGDETGQHFASYRGKSLLAIARLDQAEHQIAQVRFLAVETEEQGKSYGSMIMEATERVAMRRGDEKMIVNARENAVDFYLDLGYSVIEKSHLLFGVLQHYLMEKKLDYST